MIKHTGRVLRSVIDYMATKSSRNYIAGPTLEDAQRVSHYLSQRGYWVTQGYWDSSQDTPAFVSDVYLEGLKQLTSLSGKNYLSIKLPALGDSPALQEAVLVASDQTGISVHFDSLAPEQVGPVQTFINQLPNNAVSNIGCTLPGRWRRSVEDAQWVNELGLNVRVVKGQWNDSDNSGRDPRLGYLEVIDRLAGKARCVRVATHDVALAKEALKRLKATDTRCELELLYGLPVAGMVSIAAEMSVPVRIYIAFGHAYLPYALSSFRKQPLMILKLIKEAYRQNYLASFPVCTSNTA